MTNRRCALASVVAALVIVGWPAVGWAEEPTATTTGVEPSSTVTAGTEVPPAPSAPSTTTTYPWCAPWAAALGSWPSWLPACSDLGETKAVNDPALTIPPRTAPPLTAAGGAVLTPPPLKPVDPEPPKAPRPTPPGGWPVRSIVFPTVGPVTYYDDWGACRDGCNRFHIGNDLIGVRMQPLVAPTDGWVTHLVLDHPTAGWGIVVTDLDGWDYRYYHVNNDEPNTDDGSSPAMWRLAPGIGLGSPVRAGQLIGFMGDSGNSEYSVPHVHFEIHQPDGEPIDPYDSLRVAEEAARCNWHEGLAQLPGYIPPTDAQARVVDIATKTGEGTFTISSAGSVFLQGDARSVGWSRNRVGLTCPEVSRRAGAPPSAE